MYEQFIYVYTVYICISSLYMYIQFIYVYTVYICIYSLNTSANRIKLDLEGQYNSVNSIGSHSVHTDWMYQYYVLYLAWWWLNEPKRVAGFLIVDIAYQYMLFIDKINLLYCVYICRHLGPIEVTKWKELMAADLKRADDALSKGMITNIVKLFLEQNSMEEIPLELRPQFMKCATFIVTNEVMRYFIYSSILHCW